MTKHQSVNVENLENIPSDLSLNMRHGKPAIFTIWFGSNIMLLTVITGAMSVTIFIFPFMVSDCAIYRQHGRRALYGAAFGAGAKTRGAANGQTRASSSYGSVLVSIVV